mmetsp:Transcript_29512/g.88252  ORF Transcript_29512/g.88252 Transcript_29512/m.88252 type:complete len:197 (+) Transcript_29512:195-785(+)
MAKNDGVPRPKGRAPKNRNGDKAEWCGQTGTWLNVDPKPKKGEGKPRGRPPVGATWDPVQKAYITADGQPVVKKPKPAGDGTKKPRGRPSATPKDPNAPKKPRGRPPKTEGAPADADAPVDPNAPPSESAPPPKKRGRPKKESSGDAPAEKKPRGRPPSANKTTKPAVTGIPKPRGRPPSGKDWDSTSGTWVDKQS